MLFEWIINRLLGYVQIHLIGDSAERFFNLVNARGIHIWNVRKSNDEVLFCIHAKRVYDLKDILGKTKMKIRIKGRYGLPFFLFFHRKRKMFMLGLLTSWIIIYIMSQYVWNISFEGNMTHTDDELMKFMKSIHITEGMKQSELKLDEIEKAIRNEFFDITWASVEVSGTKLRIHMRENSSQLQINKEEKQDKQENITGDIVADKDAEIVSIITRSGTPKVRIGDIVKKDDMLIQGIYTIYADDLTVIEERKVMADGDVVGMVTYNISEKIDRKYIKKIYTGRSYTVKKIFFGDKYIEIKWPWTADNFEKWDCISLHKEVVIGDSFYLPVLSGENHYKEYELKEEIHTDDELKKLAEEKLEYILKKMEKNTIQIVDNNVKIEVADDYCVITGDIIVLEYIGSNGGTYE